MSNVVGSWNTLKLSQSIIDTLVALGFTKMTPVQAGVIPLFMQNKDVVVEAVTGSGKTLAFVIPILEKLIRRKHPLVKNEIGALIITPTRELAQQISCVFSIFLKDPSLNLRQSLFTGGTTSLQEDISRYNEYGADIIVGTPGRLEDLLVGRNCARSVINTKELEILVLDEADRLFDMGFSASIGNIIAQLPRQRRTGLFSATMTDAITEIVRAGLRNPVRIFVKVEDLITKDEQRTPATLQVGYIVCEPHQKLSQLLRLLQAETIAKKYIVYFATCACVDYFYKIFSKLPQLKRFSIYSLHGQMDTKRRSATYKNFVSLPSASFALLLCTDVAARGLDVPDVDFVIQMDAPQDPKVFSHRCGRTARAGKEGRAILFLGSGREEVYIDFLKIRKIPLRLYPYLLSNGSPYQPSTTSLNGDILEIGNASIPKIDEDNEKFLTQLRGLVLTDRDFYDKGIKAFVSYVRSYSKHEANYIFRLKDLDLGKVAKGYGLFQLPKMPELKDQQVEFEVLAVNMDEYAYANKARERKRLKDLAEAKAKLGLESNNAKRKIPPSKGPWSAKLQAKQRKIERRLKKARKKELIQQSKRKLNEIAVTHSTRAQSIEYEKDEWVELQKEERLAKKVKRGKLGQEEFERVVGNVLE